MEERLSFDKVYEYNGVFFYIKYRDYKTRQDCLPNKDKMTKKASQDHGFREAEK